MFKRRVKRTKLQIIREFLWPHMGWRRLSRYFHHRLLRLPGTPYQLASGLSFGAAISFVPLPGTHIILAAILTAATRGNVVASVVGTIVGNPWTFPLMWWAAYKIGEFAFSLFHLPVEQMPKHFVWADIFHEIEQHPFELFVPWITGGVLLALLSWPCFYMLSYRFIVKARKIRAHKKGASV